MTPTYISKEYWHEYPTPEGCAAPIPYKGQCIRVVGCELSDEPDGRQNENCEPRILTTLKIADARLDLIKGEIKLVLRGETYKDEGSSLDDGYDGYVINDEFVFDWNESSFGGNYGVKPQYSDVGVCPVTLTSYRQPTVSIPKADKIVKGLKVCSTCSLRSENSCSDCPMKTMFEHAPVPINRLMLIESSFKDYVVGQRRLIETRGRGRRSYDIWEFKRVFEANQFWDVEVEIVSETFKSKFL